MAGDKFRREISSSDSSQDTKNSLLNKSPTFTGNSVDYRTKCSRSSLFSRKRRRELQREVAAPDDEEQSYFVEARGWGGKTKQR